MVTLLLHLFSTSPDALRRPPSGCPGEPCFAPPARRLQEDGEPAEGARARTTRLGRAFERWPWLEAGSRDGVAGHCPALAAASLPQLLGQALGPTNRSPPSGRFGDRRPRQENGRGESFVGGAPHPRRTHQARPRCVRAHRLPLDPELASPAVSDLADVPRQPCPITYGHSELPAWPTRGYARGHRRSGPYRRAPSALHRPPYEPGPGGAWS